LYRIVSLAKQRVIKERKNNALLLLYISRRCWLLPYKHPMVTSLLPVSHAERFRPPKTLTQYSPHTPGRLQNPHNISVSPPTPNYSLTKHRNFLPQQCLQINPVSTSQPPGPKSSANACPSAKQSLLPLSQILRCRICTLRKDGLQDPQLCVLLFKSTILSSLTISFAPTILKISKDLHTILRTILGG
jgi:hypothetical protein